MMMANAKRMEKISNNNNNNNIYGEIVEKTEGF